MPFVHIAIGDKFNGLEVIEFVRVDPKHKHRVWKAKCHCGTIFEVATAALISKTRPTLSCGCLQRETVAKLRHKHGHASGYKQTPAYAVWQAMLRRCLTPTTPTYRHYGGRGITVCERWLPDNDGFNNFLADMGERPSKKHTLERRDNELGYSPTNCYWATWNQQGANKRNSRKLTYNGRTEVASEWARITGVPQRTILNRMNAGKEPKDVLAPWSESN